MSAAGGYPSVGSTCQDRQQNSLQVGDSASAYPLAVATPSGTVWHRFTFDGYGEQANDGVMLPEQVWDDQPPPGESSGEGTRSAAPLAWTHAQFVRLAWSIDAGTPIERPAIVACRYTRTECQ